MAVVENVSPLQYNEFEWPALDEIRRIQQREMEINRHLNLVKKKERLLWTDECGRIWIPDNAIMLQTATVCGSACGASRLLWNRYDIIQIVKIHDMENDVD